jgi:hypothetical protein
MRLQLLLNGYEMGTLELDVSMKMDLPLNLVLRCGFPQIWNYLARISSIRALCEIELAD